MRRGKPGLRSVEVRIHNDGCNVTGGVVSEMQSERVCVSSGVQSYNTKKKNGTWAQKSGLLRIK